MAYAPDVMVQDSHWETTFVQRFIRKGKRDRYLEFLKGKHRQKILERLNHNLDYEPRLSEELPPEVRSVEALLALLHSHSVTETCYLIADGNELDGRNMPLERGVDELLGNLWGAVLICPPKPIAIYKEEEIGRMILLRKQ